MTEIDKHILALYDAQWNSALCVVPIKPTEGSTEKVNKIKFGKWHGAILALW